MTPGLLIDVSIPPEEAMRRFSQAVTRASAFWHAAAGGRGAERLLGRMGKRRFRIFLGKPYSRGSPRFATGTVERKDGGSRIRVKLGLSVWNRFALVFGLLVLALAAFAATFVIGAVCHDSLACLKRVSFVVLLWLGASGAVLFDWARSLREEPRLRRALKELFADVTVSMQESS